MSESVLVKFKFKFKKPEGQAQGCILRRSMVFNALYIRQGQSGKDVGIYSTSRGVRTNWCILAQVTHVSFSGNHLFQLLADLDHLFLAAHLAVCTLPQVTSKSKLY